MKRRNQRTTLAANPASQAKYCAPCARFVCKHNDLMCDTSNRPVQGALLAKITLLLRTWQIPHTLCVFVLNHDMWSTIHTIRNRQVIGSSPIVGSRFCHCGKESLLHIFVATKSCEPLNIRLTPKPR